MTAASRPPVDQLEEVGDRETVFRLILPSQFKPAAAPGLRIQLGALPSKEWPVTTTSYCPSVFVNSLLANGIIDVAEPRWSRYGIAQATVASLRALGIHVCRSPMDCDYASVRSAHASLIGITSNLVRAQVLDLFDHGLVRAPSPP